MLDAVTRSGKHGGSASALLRNRFARTTPRLVAALAAVGIVGQVVATSFALIGEVHTPQGPPAGRASASANRFRLDPAVGQLFGLRTSSVQSPSPLSATPAVPLVLTGVIANSDPAHGFGILGSASSRTALYAVGAALPGDAHLVAVYHDRVELERSGAREVLRLPIARTHRPARAAEVAAVTTGPAPEAETAESVPAAGAVSKFWRVHHLTFESTDASGRVIGYELSGAGAHSGLRKGDVLTAINGLPLTDRNAAQELIEQTGKDSEPAQLTVLREGNPVVVTVHPDF